MNRSYLRSFSAAVVVVASCNACKGGGGQPSAPPGVTLARLTVTSKAFPSGGPIPVDMTCDGADRSPPLTWSAPPAGTRAFAVIVDDPDARAGTFTHWVAFNLPGETLALPEAVDLAQLGGSAGVNDFNRAAYGGPCPPKREIHGYAFHVFALNAPLDVPTGANRSAVETAMSGRVLAEGTLVGTFSH
jgi:Raf kinase inhibitor-like YbhB/YbcL family protein